MYRSFKERSSQQGCVGFGSAAQVSHFPTLGLSPVIQVSGEEAIAPLDSVASVSTSKLRKRSCGSFGWDGNCKVEPPLSFDVVFVRPLKERNLADQLEGFCTEFTNWRNLVNILIRQLPYFQRFTGWQLDCIANRERRRTKDQER